MVSSPTQAGVYAVSSILIAVSSACVVLRYKARRLRGAKWSVDDWLVFSTLGTIGSHTKIDSETGAAVSTPHEPDISKQFGALSAILTVLALGTLKSGVVMFYRRIFVGDRFRKISLAVILFIALWTVAFFFATVLEGNGQNLNLIWKSLVTFIGQCQKYKTIQLAHCASDVTTDLIVLLLPLPSIWRLNMSVRRKVLLSLIFLIGFVSVAAGTARLIIVAEDIVETSPGARDVLGTETNVLVWAYVEVGVGIVAACLPTLGPIFDNHSIDSVVASVRSRVSLASLGSKGSRDHSKASESDG
ncbi:hypothetical protein FHL15_011116 [Xylaria flabelliformis]|uniref:Rhodopsin domain-containing protein n=1 Tax=Xylaria flabelliformis TaxID=2512241 RepID=A0A553HJ38_9PEZI|nr:hypothetical protein FHL15_011116 [Xylaria flabelliformis]